MISKAPKALAFLETLIASIFLVSSTATAGDDPWPEIRKALFNDRAIVEDATIIQIFAPNQADDAALVPISIKISSAVVPKVRSITLIIDRNPMPVAATISFGDGYRQGPDIGDRTIATRVRVDNFSRIRAVLQTADGNLAMASKFVIGSGGCSAPASKDSEEALAQLGKTQLVVRQNDASGKDWREVRVMIKHPNFTGMQMNNKTGDYTPARFVNFVEVKQGGLILWSMNGGISISEDPNFRFTFSVHSPGDIEFIATDTNGAKFTAAAAISPPS